MTVRELHILKAARGRNPVVYFIRLMRMLQDTDSSFIGRESLAKLKRSFPGSQWKTAKDDLALIESLEKTNWIVWREGDGTENYAYARIKYNVEEKSKHWTIRWEE